MNSFLCDWKKSVCAAVTVHDSRGHTPDVNDIVFVQLMLLCVTLHV